MIGRIPITDVRPQVACRRWPAKAVVAETVPVSATIFREGHDLLGANVVLLAPDGKEVGEFNRMRIVAAGTDRWEANITLPAEGLWSFVIEAWSDPLGTWWHDAAIKVPAGQDIELMLEEGARLYERAAAGVPKGKKASITRACKALRDAGKPGDQRFAAAMKPDLVALLEAYPVREHVTASDRYEIRVERERALFGAWYEFFPRSIGSSLDPPHSGNFKTATEHLAYVKDLGFDVVYLPPIHPIGHAFRKGANNSLVAGPADPGSPWAIGSEDGGHDAIHPDLGTIDDFDNFVARARELGMEVALDLALQCSPDHPWVKEHPEWFTVRADGSIAYAENPPKKYQDIYPVNFDNDPEGIYHEVLRVVRHWMDHGVRIFRVDNPHTKPVAFWEWLIAEITKTDPDIIFLSEAFTRPPMMRMLAQIGFTQSYTYFTWRNEKWEIEEYARELSTETVDYMRPNFFVNTPDILHAFLQYGGPPAFKIRAVLASMLSPSWGVYSGYELFEATAVRAGSEEYLDSEKYQYKPRNFDRPDSLAPYLKRLNEIRRAHPALRWLRNLHFHWTEGEQITAFSKREGDDVILVVVNLDPHSVRESTVHLDLPALGLDWQDGVAAHDLITGATYDWGPHNYVRLDPFVEPAHVFEVRRRG